VAELSPPEIVALHFVAVYARYAIHIIISLDAKIVEIQHAQ
jgi:hypothetical protein